MRMPRFFLLGVALAAATAFTLTGCDSGTDPTPPPTPTPTPIPRAAISVTISNTRWAVSAASGFQFAFGFDMRIQETAGVGADLDHIRADFYSGPNGTGQRLERQQIPGRGLNRLAANGSMVDSFVARFNAGGTSSVVITTRFTDDGGNVVETSREYNCCSPMVGPLAR